MDCVPWLLDNEQAAEASPNQHRKHHIVPQARAEEDAEEMIEEETEEFSLGRSGRLRVRKGKEPVFFFFANCHKLSDG